MNNDEYFEFLRSLLIKIENVINLLDQEIPKHILAYHKALGVQQKIAGLDDSYRNRLFPQMVNTRSVVHFLLNGKYEEAYKKTNQLKGDLIKICLNIRK